MKSLTLIFYDDFNHKNIQTLMVLSTKPSLGGDVLVSLKIMRDKNEDISGDIDNCVKRSPGGDVLVRGSSSLPLSSRLRSRSPLVFIWVVRNSLVLMI